MSAAESPILDDDFSSVGHALHHEIRALHKQHRLDEADELLDARLPYGTVAYFSQLTRNGQARAFLATTYTELERAEDFHDELHDYLRWQERHAARLTGEERQEFEYTRGRASINDSDLFWRIAGALCRIEGPEPGIAYIKEYSHDPHITAIALNAVYRAAFERRSLMPAHAKQFGAAVLEQIEVNVIARELDQRLLIAHGYDGATMRLPVGTLQEPTSIPYTETLV